MKFSQLGYERPDYVSVKNRLREHQAQIQGATSYEALRSAWLDAKNVFHYMEYHEMIAYIHALRSAS